jgi:hypothetical protein
LPEQPKSVAPEVGSAVSGKETNVTEIGPGLIEVSVVYGLGSVCKARFDLEKIIEWSARKVILDVVGRPRPAGPEARTAKVIAEALRQRREIDLEMVVGPCDEKTAGTPMALEDPVIPEGTTARTCSSNSITLRLSEPYRGGAAESLSTCDPVRL